jgi:hypothetical protein
MIICKITGDAKGHTHITRGEDFLIAGGDEDVHHLLQEMVIKLDEKINGRDLTVEEILTALRTCTNELGNVEAIDYSEVFPKHGPCSRTHNRMDR